MTVAEIATVIKNLKHLKEINMINLDKSNVTSTVFVGNEIENPSTITCSTTPYYYDKGIEPVEYINANNLDFFEGNVIKYITRHKEKNGATDIMKAIRYCKMILKYKYGKDEV